MKLMLKGLVVLMLMLPTVVLAAGEEEEGPWAADAALNAIVNTGNSENITIGGAANASWEEDNDKVSWEAKGAFGRSTVLGVSTTTTKNFITKVRYDRFFLEKVIGAFALAHIGFDTPAGFDLRTGGAFGFVHYFLREMQHKANYEVGPDFTFEDRTNGTKDGIIAARGALNYKYKISKTAKLTNGFETLVNLEDTDDVRLNNITALTFKMTDIMSFQASFEVRTDFQPVPGFKKTDTTTMVGLIFDIV